MALADSKTLKAMIEFREGRGLYVYFLVNLFIAGENDLNPFPAIDNKCLLSRLLKYFGSLYCKQYVPRSDCSKNGAVWSGFILFAFMMNKQVSMPKKCHNHRPTQDRGGSRISGKGVWMYKCVGVQFADLISFCFNIPWKWNNLVSLRPNYFIFIGYLKMGGGGGGGGAPEPPLDPPLQEMQNTDSHNIIKVKQLAHLPLQDDC